MIICKDCGHQNEENDEFCGSCGSFLEWSGTRVAPAGPRTVEPVAAEPEKEGILGRAKRAIEVDDDSVARNDAQLATQMAQEQAEAERVAAEVRARAAAEEAAAQEKAAEEAARRAEAEADAKRRAAEEATARAAAEAEAAKQRAEAQAAEAARKAASEAEAARVRADEEARAAEARVAAEAEAARQAAAATHEDARRKAAADADAARRQAEAEAAAAAEAERRRREAEEQVARAAADMAAAARRAREERDAIASAEAAKALAEAEASKARAEADAARAAAEAMAAQARAEAEAAKAEAARLRAEAQTREAELRASAAAAEAEQRARADAELAKARAEAQAEAARRRAESETEAARVRAAAEADAAQARAEAEAARARAEAEAAELRAEKEKAARQAEAAEARKRQEEALRKAQALVATPKAVVPEDPKPSRPTTARPSVEERRPTEEAGPPVEARKPSESAPKIRPKVVKASRELNPGDLICGNCGAGSPPTRKFCTRCGNSLKEAVVVSIPWWRRLWLATFGRLFGRKRRKAGAGTPAGVGAGTGAPGTVSATGGPGAPLSKKEAKSLRKHGDNARAGVQMGFFRVQTVMTRLVGVVAALALVGVAVPGPWKDRFVFPSVRQWVQRNVQSVVSPKYDPVRPFNASADKAEKDHDGAKAIDGFANTYWAAPGARGTAKNLTITFQRPTDIDRIGFTAGADGDAFLVHDRPREVTVAFDTGQSTTLELKDQYDFQTKSVKGRQVRKIVMTINSVYPSAAGGAVAISELEFFEKRKFGTQYEYLDPDRMPQVTASSSAPGKAPGNLIDLQLGTAWVSGDGGTGQSQSLSFRFPQPVDIDRIRIAGGASTTAAEYLNQPRPKEMQLTFSNAVSKIVTIPDSPGFHNISVKAHQVTSLDIVITAVYGQVNPNAPTGVAIAEMEFQTKKK